MSQTTPSITSPSQVLLPCPFCGSGDVGGGSGIVHCYQRGIQTQKYETTAYAGTVWNTRAQQPTAPGGEVQDWQPIETAPPGAKGIAFMLLAWGPDEDKCSGAGMRIGDKFYASSIFHKINGDKSYEFREHEVIPTHWMPSPAAPSPAKEQGQ